MKPRIYHNSRCSKSRATLELLRSHGVDIEVVDYQRNPPTSAALRAIARKLGVDPRALVRTGEAEFERSGLDLAAASDDQIIELLCVHPKLLQRPIVEVDDAARIGRPPESVLDLFE